MSEIDPVAIDSAAELLDFGINIENVQFLELHVEAYESTDAEQLSEAVPTWGLKLRHEGAEFGIRLSVSLEVGLGNIRVDAAVNYLADAPVEMTEATRLEFANKVGVMALLPYVRQAVADLSQRVFGEIVLMPVMRQGDLKFGPDADEDASA